MKLRIEDGVPLENVFRRVSEESAGFLAVERAGVWLLTNGQTVLRCADLYESSKRTHSSGATLRTDEFPEYFASLGRRRTVPAEVAATDPRTSGLADAYLNPLGITSLLDAPIFVGGDVVGVLCCEHVGPHREWTTEQRDFASAMADTLALKIRASETEDLRAALRTQEGTLEEARHRGDLAVAAAGVAHDFKNILTVMMGLADLIHTAPDCPPALAAFARQSLVAGDRGVALARQLMELARPGPRASRVVCPAEYLPRVLDLVRTAAGPDHRIDWDVKSARGNCLIDPLQLERIILNLVVNARDAMPGGGTIRLSVDSQATADNYGRAGMFVVIEVADKGTGIPPDVLAKIFEPYFTTKARGHGTGVGLAIVQQAVQYAGGFVRVESAPGQGSTFRVFLPHVSTT